jgi:TolA-binding protein
MQCISANLIEQQQQKEEAPVEQPVDNHYMTREFLESQLVQNKNRIAELEQHIQNVTQRDYSTRGELQGMRDGMHEWTMNALEQREISETNAEEIADICGFELTKEIEAEVNVTYYITLQVPAGEDAESIINDIDFDAVTYDTDKVTHVSSSVDAIDF